MQRSFDNRAGHFPVAPSSSGSEEPMHTRQVDNPMFEPIEYGGLEYTLVSRHFLHRQANTAYQD